MLALDFSPDGKLLAAGGGEPSRSGELKLWDVGKGELVRSLDSLHSDTVFALRFSPDGTKLASAAADKFLKVTNVADGKELRSFEGHTHHVMAVDWKSDGKQLITGGADKVLKLWDFDSGEQVRTLRRPASRSPPRGGSPASPRSWPPRATPRCGSGTRTAAASPASFSGPSDYVFSVAASADGIADRRRRRRRRPLHLERPERPGDPEDRTAAGPARRDRGEPLIRAPIGRATVLHGRSRTR